MTSLRFMLVGAIAAAAAFSPRPVQAWHEVGHMAGALVAYRQLDLDSQAKVIELLKKHPHYGDFLSKQVPADATFEEWVVMRAAIWPDWVRPKKDKHHHVVNAENASHFHHGEWHYINLPIVDLDGADPETKAKIEENSKKKRGDVLKVLPVLLGALKEPNGARDLLIAKNKDLILTDAQVQAVALCWVLHLIPDLHQPLHAAAFFAKDSVKGDSGGNAMKVNWKNEITDLHTLWDGKFAWDGLRGMDNSQYGAVDALLRDRLHGIKLGTDELAVLKPEKWADESLALAKEKAYYSHGVRIPSHILEQDEHQPDVMDIHPLPNGYGNLVARTAEKRVALAGHRLAATLKQALPQ